jgi:hypothetical protein
MLSFFPSPYPDEILYSVFARYHVRSGNISAKVTLRELFGSSNNTATIDFPCNINSLIKNMPIAAPYTKERFIKDNTLYSFYAPFLPKERANMIYKSMLGNSGGDIHSRIGIMASKVVVPKYLRYCPECFKEDKSIFGEAYWHRLHQISSYIFCSKHGVFIEDSNILAKAVNKHEFYTASDENCISKALEFKSCKIGSCIKIIRAIEWILNSKLKIREIDWFYKKYKVELFSKGFCSNKGRVYQEMLLQHFGNFYSKDILKLFQSDIEDIASNWLTTITRKPRIAFHPIRHILLMNYLSDDIESFFKAAFNPKANGKQGIEPLAQKPLSNECEKESTSEEYPIVYKKRKIWNEMKSSYPELSKTELRKINKKIYIWLYRHDKEWLDSNSPSRKKIVYINNRVNWKNRDKEILEKVILVVNEIITSKDKPERVTISKVSKKLGMSAIMEKHLDRLTETKAYLATVTEDIEAYQIRRVKWVAEYLNSQGEELIEWKIFRIAGLKPTCSEKVKKIIREQVNFYELR